MALSLLGKKKPGRLQASLWGGHSVHRCLLTRSQVPNTRPCVERTKEPAELVIWWEGMSSTALYQVQSEESLQCPNSELPSWETMAQKTSGKGRKDESSLLCNRQTHHSQLHPNHWGKCSSSWANKYWLMTRVTDVLSLTPEEPQHALTEIWRESLVMVFTSLMPHNTSVWPGRGWAHKKLQWAPEFGRVGHKFFLPVDEGICVIHSERTGSSASG